MAASERPTVVVIMLDRSLWPIIRELNRIDRDAAQLSRTLAPPPILSAIDQAQSWWLTDQYVGIDVLKVLGLPEVITSVQRRHESMELDALRATSGLASFINWLDTAQADFLTLHSGTTTQVTNEFLKLNFLALDGSAAIVGDLASRFGATSPLTRQGEFLLSAYRDFASWLNTPTIAGPAGQEVSPITVAGTAMATRLLTGAVGILTEADADEAAEPTEDPTPPTFYRAFTTEIEERRLSLVELSADEAEEQLALSLPAQITTVARRVVVAWAEANEAALLNYKDHLFSLSNELFLCGSTLQGHVVNDRSGFASLMDWLYKLLVDAGDPNEAGGNQRIRAVREEVMRAPIIRTVNMLRNQYSHSPKSMRRAQRTAGPVSDVFHEFSGVRSPHSPQEWQKVQLELLTRVADYLAGLPDTINSGQPL